MAQTKEGAAKAKATILAKYGEDYFVRLGKAGGVVGRTGGFHVTKHYPLDHPANPRNAGRVGGRMSKPFTRKAKAADAAEHA